MLNWICNILTRGQCDKNSLVISFIVTSVLWWVTGKIYKGEQEYNSKGNKPSTHCMMVPGSPYVPKATDVPGAQHCSRTVLDRLDELNGDWGFRSSLTLTRIRVGMWGLCATTGHSGCLRLPMLTLVGVLCFLSICSFHKVWVLKHK